MMTLPGPVGLYSDLTVLLLFCLHRNRMQCIREFQGIVRTFFYFRRTYNFLLHPLGSNASGWPASKSCSSAVLLASFSFLCA